MHGILLDLNQAKRSIYSFSFLQFTVGHVERYWSEKSDAAALTESTKLIIECVKLNDTHANSLIFYHAVQEDNLKKKMKTVAISGNIISVNKNDKPCRTLRNCQSLEYTII